MSSAAAMAFDAAFLRRRRPSETASRSLNATPQRPATAPPPGGDNATDFFMARLTLRRCYHWIGAQAPDTAPGRALCPPAGVSGKSIDWPPVSTAAHRKQKLTISQALLANIAGKIFHGPACSLPSSHQQLPARPHCFSACASQL